MSFGQFNSRQLEIFFEPNSQQFHLFQLFFILGIWSSTIMSALSLVLSNDDPHPVLPLRVLGSTRSTADVTEEILSRAP